MAELKLENGTYKASNKDQQFLTDLRNANLVAGDTIVEENGTLEVVKVFNGKGEYEERLSPTVMYRKTFEDGYLLRKQGTNNFVFISFE